MYGQSELRNSSTKRWASKMLLGIAGHSMAGANANKDTAMISSVVFIALLFITSIFNSSEKNELS